MSSRWPLQLNHWPQTETLQPNTAHTHRTWLSIPTSLKTQRNLNNKHQLQDWKEINQVLSGLNSETHKVNGAWVKVMKLTMLNTVNFSRCPNKLWAEQKSELSCLIAEQMRRDVCSKASVRSLKRIIITEEDYYFAELKFTIILSYKKKSFICWGM